MRVLIVSFWFPPANVVGAIRVGKLARYLDRHGYEVRILTTKIGEDLSLPLEIPIEQVIYTDYRQRRDRLAELVSDAEQVLVTAAVPADIPAGLAGAQFTVKAGSVSGG